MKKDYSYTNIYAKDFNLYFNKIVEDIKELSKKLSELDKLQQQILHYVESEELDEDKAFKLFKYLKDVRKQRREVKINLKYAFEIKRRLSEPLPKKIKCSYDFIDFDEILRNI